MATLTRYRESQGTGGGTGTSRSVQRIRSAVKSGQISVIKKVLKQGQRIDQVAFEVYGDSRLWWIIAAASNIGWWMQCPPGTELSVPNDLGQVERVM